MSKEILSGLEYERAPMCLYSHGACAYMRKIGDEPTKCFYKKGPKKCCFAKEVPKDVLEHAKT